MPITTIDELHDHLQQAINLEFFVAAPYLYAMYSVADPASEATKVLKSVAAEEMLHAALIGNVLLAVGGEPRFYDPSVIASFPALLPHHDPEVMVNLEPLSRDLIERVFHVIEEPGDDEDHVDGDSWRFLGQFYKSLEHGIAELGKTTDLFSNPQIHRQMNDPHGYAAPKYDAGSSGGLRLVETESDADEVIEIVIHQGEGVSDARFADPDHAELTHYAKFLDLDDETTETILPAMVNPSLESLPSEVQPVAEFSNAIYSYLFVVMDRLMGPDEVDRHHLVGTLYGSMVALLAPVARYLMTMPVGDDRVAGPPMGFYQFKNPKDAEAEVRRLGSLLAKNHPVLRPAINLLDRLPN
ncbi:MAG: ferritin-like protein [Actinomycetes bacterium]